MDRKLGAGVRSSRSISRYDRPRIVVAPRTYMDVMTPATAGSVQPVVKPAHAKKDPVQVRHQALPSKYFDVKPAVMQKPNLRIAPTLKPISKEPIIPVSTPVAPQVAETAPEQVAVESPAAPVQEQQAEPAPLRKKRRLLKKPSAPRVLHGMAILLFIAGVYVAADGWLANRAVVAQADVLSAQAEKDPEQAPDGRDTLSEAKPASVKGYRVAPDLPRAISIPSLKVSARVLHLGVKKDNSLAAPTNIYDAGWYTASARPTDKGGAILIDGHVSGPTKPGVFYGLKKLVGGEEIILERGDGQTLTFLVKHVETVNADRVDMLKLLNSAEPGKLGLNLITCGGEFDASDSSYKSRVLVFAVQK